MTESEILAPEDLDKAVSLSIEKAVLTLISLKVSKCFSNLKIPLSK